VRRRSLEGTNEEAREMRIGLRAAVPIAATLALHGCGGGGGGGTYFFPTEDATIMGGADLRAEGSDMAASRLRRIFVTSTAVPSNFGGIEAADTLCNDSAQGANLTGPFRAWLSTRGVNAIDRIEDLGPWYLVDSLGSRNVKVFNNRTQMKTTPLHAIDRDERGIVWKVETWTGTIVGGRTSTRTCDDWVVPRPSSNDGTVGDSGATTGSWTDKGNIGGTCTGTRRFFYCIEQ
jgi:hypothetical protein